MKTISFFTNKKKNFSLPKTQPTKSSSTQHIKYQINESNNIKNDQFYQIQTCPEVSCFNPYDDHQLYTHKIKIDYGRLSEPIQWPKKTIKADIYQNNTNEDIRQTQRQIKKQSYIFNSKQTACKSKSLVKLGGSVQLINPKDEELFNTKKSLCIKQENTQAKNKSLKKQNPQLSNAKKSIVTLNNQHYPKLKQVLAAKKGQQLNETTNKNSSQQTTYRNQLSNENIIDRQKTHRPAPHCRIVRSYVGGSKMQIKIISYPDSSQYMKLCGFNK